MKMFIQTLFTIANLSVIDQMLMSMQNSYVEDLTPNVFGSNCF